MPADRTAPALDLAAVAEVPVWRFLKAGESTDPEADESWVRACAQPPGAGEHASYLVRAGFELASGHTLTGLVQVDVLGPHLEFTPCVLFAGGRSVDVLARETPQRLRRLLHADHGRPRRWRLEVPLRQEDRCREGTLTGSTLLEALGLLARLARLHRLRRPG